MRAKVAAQAAPAASNQTFSRLMWLFGIVYVVEACCEPRGLIGQPLMLYAKEALGWSPVRVSALFSLFALPWLLKPIYGLATDLFPIFGDRRRPYLLLANTMAGAAYLLTCLWATQGMPVTALMVVFFGMAISSAVAGGFLVESGQRAEASELLVNQQWLWLGIASAPVSLAGGWLAGHLPAATVLRTTSAMLAAAPLLVVISSWLLLKRPTEVNAISGALSWPTLRSLINIRLIIAALFLFLYMFSPGLYVALYYHMTDDLGFTQAFIGELGSVSAAGSICGALLHRYTLRKAVMRHMVYLVLTLGVLSTLSYLFLTGPWSAVIINFVSGAVGTLTIIVAATLAADFCPRGLEAFGYAILATVENLAIRISDVSGSYLYDRVLAHKLAPLVLASAAATAFPLLLVRFLGLGEMKQGAAVVGPTPT